MTILEIIEFLETKAPGFLQEDYDNAGLITGDKSWECTGILVSLDATEEVITEAISQNCNLVIAHHPIVFRGLKRFNGSNYVERTVIHAIKNDIAIYAIHTNLDNVIDGVNGKMADILGLIDRQILAPKSGILTKLAVFVPLAETDRLRNALFAAGAGQIGRYSECSFEIPGTGTYKPQEGSQPFAGEVGSRHSEAENRLEVIFPAWLQTPVLAAMRKAHPYEEIAYDLVPLANANVQTGSGIIGSLSSPLEEQELLRFLKDKFTPGHIRHTPLLGKAVSKVAVCGGAGSFLIAAAKAAGAQVFITSDVKYHEFFDADGRLVLADIGHYESERFTIDLLDEILREKFPNFAVLKTRVNTNPVQYF